MPNLSPQPVQYLSIQQASELLKVSPKTLRRWESSNLIHPRRNRLNQRLYSMAEIELLQNRKYKPLNSQPLSPDTVLPISPLPKALPKQVAKLLPVALTPLLSLVPFALVVLPILLFILFGYKPSLPLESINTAPEVEVNQLESSTSTAATDSSQPNRPILSRIPRGEVAGITATGGSLLSFENIIDDNYNFGVAGTVEGNQLISATTVKPPLLVTSRELVTNLNADLLDGHSWEEIEAVAVDPMSLQNSYDAGNSITTTGNNIIFTLSGSDQFSIGGSGSVSFTNSGSTSFSGPVTLAGDLALNSGNLTSTQSTTNLLNSGVTTLNLGGEATSLNLGASSGTTTINNTLAIAGGLTSAGTISIRPNSDNDDYIYISTSSDQPGLFFAGATSSNDPGFRVNSSTGRLEFREAGSTTWNPFSSGSTTNYISDGGAYVYPTGRESVRIYDSSGVDFLDISHDGTNVLLTTNGTTEVRLDNDLVVNGNLSINGTLITATSAELNLLDGVTSLYTNPLTTAGDILYGGASGTPTRLPGAATDNLVLKYDLDTNIPYWGTDNTGTTYTSSNGLTLSGSDFQLGGLIAANTRLYDADAELLYLDSTNNRVGIGTTDPGYLLDVAGDINSTTGTYRLAGADVGQYFIDSAGTNGQVWTSDGTGRGGWTTPSTGTTYTSSNGITLSGTDFQLGGLVTGNTRLYDADAELLYLDSTNNRVGIGTTNPLASLTVGEFGTTSTFSDGYEDNTLDPFTTSGDASWAVQGSTIYEGTYAAKAGTITHTQQTVMSLAQTLVNASEISFYVSTSSEATFDHLAFYIDDIRQNIWSGTTAWTNFRTHVSAGSHVFKWIYTKDSNGSSGSDTAWVDGITIYTQTTNSFFAGAVGIGNTNPAHALDVIGNINSVGSYLINGRNAISMTSHDIFIGPNAGKNNSGTGNIAIGEDAGTSMTGAVFNTMVGYQTGMKSVTGLYNSYYGARSGLNDIGSYNSFIGARNGEKNTTGMSNSYLGYAAGYFNTTGSNNLYLGNFAGYANTTGNYNIAIGSRASAANTPNNLVSSITIGSNASASASNQLVIGSDAHDLNYISEGYFGSGVVSTNPRDFTMLSTGGSGTNKAGANLILSGGKGTGTGLGGSLIFKTADALVSGTTLQSITEKMRLTAAGNLGIGTTNPTEKLDVNGDISISGDGDALKFTDPGDSYVYFDDSNSVYIYDYTSDSSLNLETGGSTGGDIFLNPNTDQVGINNYNAAYALDVTGDINATSAYRINGIDISQYFIDAAGTNGQVWTSDGTGRGGWTTPAAGTVYTASNGLTLSGSDFQLGGLIAANTRLYDADAELLYLDSTNNRVGIGTTDPLSTLSVNGSGRFIGDLAIGNPNDTQSLTSGALLLGNGPTSFLTDKTDAYIYKTGSNSGSYPFNNFGNLVLQPRSTSAVPGDIVLATGGTTPTVRMTVNSSGNVGIGTTVPGSKLHVAGQLLMGDAIHWGNEVNARFYGDNTAKLIYLDSNGNHRLVVDQYGIRVGSGYSNVYAPAGGAIIEGNVGIGTTAPTANLDISGDASASGSLVLRNTSLNTIDALNGGRMAFNTSVGGDTGLNERLTILNNGNIGIGTTNPTKRLEIVSGPESQLHLSATGVDKATAISMPSNHYMRIGGSTTTDVQFLIVGSDYSGIPGRIVFRYGDSGSLWEYTDGTNVYERMRLDTTGNLGIGTTNPQTRLNLSDNGTYTFAAGGLSFGDGDTGLFESSDDVLVARTGGADRLVMSSSAMYPAVDKGLDLGTSTNYWNNLYLNGNTIHFDDTNDATLGFDNVNDRFYFNSDGLTNPEMVLTAAGNLGIGTTDPGYLLDVAGDINTTTGTYRLAGADVGQYFIDAAGTNGQVWTSDGTGRGGWTTPSVGTNYLQLNSQQLSPTNSTFDLMTGGISTASAKFYAQGTSGNGYFAGNLGIGTTNPGQELDVVGDIQTSGDLYLNGSDIRSSTNGILRAYAGTSFSIDLDHNNDETTNFFSIHKDNMTSELFRVQENGYVGIGTTNPGSKLTLAGGNFTHTASGNPTLAGSYNTSGTAYQVYVSGKYAYVADYDAGLQVIDISNPAAPALVGTYDTISFAIGVQVSGKYAYVADAIFGLQVIDISNPAAPALVGTYDTSDNAQEVYVSGKYAYVADDASGLQVIDISNPAAPALVGTYNTSGNAYGVYVSGKYAYVADDASGLQVIDISNPAAPALVGTYNTSGRAYGVYVSGKYAYLADHDSGLQVIDISNPAAPALVGTYNTSGTAYGVYVSGKYAYVADDASGLQVIDISNPAAPALVGTYDTSGTAYQVYISGKYAYVADGNSGLQVIDINGIETPSLYAGNIATNALTVTENADIGNDLYVRNGLNVGPGGIFSQGNFATIGNGYFSGNLGIGTTNPQQALHVYRATDGAPVRFEDSNGYCEIDPTSTTWTCTSDIRLKKDIETVGSQNSLDIINDLNSISFHWTKETESAQKHLGFIAQEVEQVIPQLVSTDENGYKSVAYGAFTPLLVSAIQQLNLNLDQVQTHQVDQFSLLSAEVTTQSNSFRDLVASITSLFDRQSQVETKVTTIVDNVSLLKGEQASVSAALESYSSRLAYLETQATTGQLAPEPVTIATISADISLLKGEQASVSAALESYTQKVDLALDLTASQSALIAALLEPPEPNEPPSPIEPPILSDLNLDVESIFISDFLSVMGETILTDATVTNTLTLSSISSLDGQLDFLSSLMTLDAAGSLVTINGDLIVTGQLTAPILDEMSLQLASLSAQINELTISRSNDQTLMASLSAQFASLSASTAEASGSGVATPSADQVTSETEAAPPSARLLQLATQP